MSIAASAQAQTLDAELVATGLESPLLLTAPPGDADRLFVLEMSGRVRVVQDGVLLPAPFLDLSATITSGGEQGLLGLAFHPRYSSNGRFFVYYTDDVGDIRVTEFEARPPSSDVADPAAVQTILAQVHPHVLHNGGHLEFGPDGMLYVGLGDGAIGNAQDGTTNLGKMLRLDVDAPPPFVPADNPFVGDPSVKDEIWLLGLRNPWRWSFDRGTGDLYIGDVGNDREEIDFLAAGTAGGQNLGWPCLEGTRCTNDSACSCFDVGLTAPIHEYLHDPGSAVIGGYVYRGSAIPSLVGAYVFGDYAWSRIWTLRVRGGVVTELVERTDELSSEITVISSFGQDADGELYVVDLTGSVFRIVERTCGDVERYCSPAVANSTGTSGVLTIDGSLDARDDDLSLRAMGLPLANVGYFVMGAGTDALVPPGSAGPICVLPGLARLLPSKSDTSELDGGFERNVGTRGPQTRRIQPGSTWRFQAWYRDAAAGGSNFTDALEVTFCP